MREGVVAEGTLTSVAESNLRIHSVSQWVITYRYQDYRGRTHEGQSGYLSPEEAATWRVGDTGTIRYDRRRPQDSVWGKAKKEALHSEEQSDRTHSVELSAPRNRRVEEAQFGETTPPSLYQLAKRSPWVWIAGIVLLLSLIFFGLSMEERRYEAQGQIVQGTVLSKVANKKYVMYRFTTRHGQTIEGKHGDVLADIYYKLLEGGPVEVEYLPGSPETNRIPGQSAKSSTYRNIGGFLLLASAVLLLIGFRKAYFRFRLLRQPPSIA